MMHLGRQFKKGFTLIEALLASAILAMVVMAIVMPFSAGIQNEGTDGRRTLALNLGQEMMEEVMTKPFYDPAGVMTPGPESGETRATFNCIDDYHGLIEPDGQIKGFDGTTVTGAAGLSRQVTAAYVYVSGQNTQIPPTFIRVTVEVRYMGQGLVVLSRLVFAGH